jgi:hypothetical protein
MTFPDLLMMAKVGRPDCTAQKTPRGLQDQSKMPKHDGWVVFVIF